MRLCRARHSRKNWLFVGNDEAAEVNAAFVSLLASSLMHSVEPWAYLRDLFCLLPSWPARRVFELAPVHWRETSKQQETQQRLAADPFRRAALELAKHPDSKQHPLAPPVTTWFAERLRSFVPVEAPRAPPEGVPCRAAPTDRRCRWRADPAIMRERAADLAIRCPATGRDGGVRW